MECSYCKKEESVIKAGFERKKQRYWCKSCARHFTEHAPRGVSPEVKQRAVAMYREGLGLRSIGRLLGYSQVSIMKWVEQAAEVAKNQTEPLSTSDQDVIELDELWHYVGRKKRSGGFG
jgi:transposase-like protein